MCLKFTIKFSRTNIRLCSVLFFFRMLYWISNNTKNTTTISKISPPANREDLGPRFPDMSEIYRREYRKIIWESSKALNIDLQEGTYLQFTGPAYESPAEIRMVRTLGADAVGMSTACEAVAANHMGMKILGISFISNLAAGMSTQPLSHKEVQEAADLAAPKFRALVTEVIRRIGEHEKSE